MNRQSTLHRSFSRKSSDEKERMLEEIIDHIDDQDPDDLSHFLTLFYSSESLEDVKKTQCEVCYKIGRALWQKFKQRAVNEIKIELFNPKEEKRGYDSQYTVIEILQKDLPFLVDSLVAHLQRENYNIHRLFHPIIRTRRDDEGNLLSVHSLNDQGPDLLLESVRQFQIDRIREREKRIALQKSIESVMKDIWTTVRDWRSMQSRVADAISEIDQSEWVEPKNKDEAIQFLDFLKADNFTFLGYREYGLEKDKDSAAGLFVKSNKGLGVLRNNEKHLFGGLRDSDTLAKRMMDRLSENKPFLVIKSSLRSNVHRPVYMDVIVVKTVDKKGQITRLRIFAGLFTAECYTRPTPQIPYLCGKVNRVMNDAGFKRDSHSGKALRHVIDTYPRDELFQINIDDLIRISHGIMRLQYHPGVDIFIREDLLQRYFSCLVYTPREQYNTNTREIIQTVLEKALQGKTLTYFIDIDEKPLARVHFLIGTDQETLPDYNREALRQKLFEATRSWTDELYGHTISLLGREKAITILEDLADSFPAGYQDEISPAEAARDLHLIQLVRRDTNISVSLEQIDISQPEKIRFKIFHRSNNMALSAVLPILKNMGLAIDEEHPYEINIKSEDCKIWLHDFHGSADISRGSKAFSRIKERFEEAFIQIWQGQVDNDTFNRLIIHAGFNGRQTVIVRALSRYLMQANYPFSEQYISNTLCKHAAITTVLVEYFERQHDPNRQSKDDQAQSAKILKRIHKSLEAVDRLDEDRVLRSILNLIKQTLRTNYYQTNAEGQSYEYLTFKLRSSELTDLPEPRPAKEIYIYSRRFEAVHLRGGDVARGGIRWSDRFEDFRTEILGLVKAQMVKNAVIIPTGSKGGFICKRLESITDRDERQAEAITCYKTFMRGMLNITDNIIEGEVVAPKGVVRLDDDDPYLVVAADKGTATFSDLANAVSEEKNFWLGDAFASGGSVGYDHKAMGITARGAWESVKRHFRELGKDIQTEPFTVIGVGDMSGDVFGNGMLLSKQIRLQAAFDHRHIFIDPDPDPAKSWKERKRLFEMDRSTWLEYNKDLISKGGRIYDRSEKSLELTPEIKDLTGLETDTITPYQLMNALLRSDCELLWFGGIGTYIKASTQSHADVGDKANDAIRVDGQAVRAKVIGEGANLGVTQDGRIEYAKYGGKINTDFIDNSGGVDTSDHEVNLKIMFNNAIEKERLDKEQRNEHLEAMETEVGLLVLKNNYDQSLAITLAHSHGRQDLAQHRDFITCLEKEGYFNREVENLPRDEHFQTMQKQGDQLSRPELSVLLCYAKMRLYDQLIRSSLPDDKAMIKHLSEYFPHAVRKEYEQEIKEHRLAREIIATEITNVIVNKMGPVFMYMMERRTGATPADIARGFLLTRSIFNLRDIWAQIDALDNKIDADTQTEMYMSGVHLITRSVKWMVIHHALPLDYGQLSELYVSGVDNIRQSMKTLVPPVLSKSIEYKTLHLIEEKNVPDKLALSLARLPALLLSCDIVRLAADHDLDLKDVAKTYYKVTERFRFGILINLAENMSVSSHWGQDARDGIIEDLYRSLSAIASMIIQKYESLEEWEEEHAAVTTPIDDLLNEIQYTEELDFQMITLLSQRIRSLT